MSTFKQLYEQRVFVSAEVLDTIDSIDYEYVPLLLSLDTNNSSRDECYEWLFRHTNPFENLANQPPFIKQYLLNYDIGRLFEADVIPKNKYLQLKRSKKSNIDEFLIDVYGHNANDFRQQMRVDAGNILVRSPNNRQMQFNTKQQAIDKLNYYIDFNIDWDDVIIAGGFLNKILLQDAGDYYENSDMDLFLICETAKRERILRKILKNIAKASNEIYYGVNQSVIYIYRREFKIPIQIICMNSKSAFDTISRFDYDNIKFCAKCDDGEWNFYGTTNALQSIYSATSKFIDMRGFVLKRFTKTILRGFNVIMKEDEYNGHNIPNILQNIADYEGELMYMETPFVSQNPKVIMAQIKKISVATFVTTDIQEILERVVLNGNFNKGYKSEDIGRVNFANIIAPKLGNKSFALHERSDVAKYPRLFQITLKLKITSIKKGEKYEFSGDISLLDEQAMSQLYARIREIKKSAKIPPLTFSFEEFKAPRLISGRDIYLFDECYVTFFVKITDGQVEFVVKKVMTSIV